MSKKYDHNIVSIYGRLTKDPELSYTANQKAVVKFSIANQCGDDVNFFDVVCFDKIAVSVSTYMKKGNPVIVDGRLKQSRFQDKNGQNRAKIEIVSNGIQFIPTNKAPEVGQDNSIPIPPDNGQVDDSDSEVSF